jgi:hypothetical protein
LKHWTPFLTRFERGRIYCTNLQIWPATAAINGNLTMDLWIQPCAKCADLYGKPSTEAPHHELTLNGSGAAGASRIEQHYTCDRCRAAFVRVLAGPPTRQIWMLLNASQH